MAHELDFQKGSAAFIGYKQPAWHGLGVIIDTDISTADALKLGGLDFIVEKLPNRHHMPTGKFYEDGQPIFDQVESKNSFFTYRTDTNHILGDKLGTKYEVFQNEEALAIIDLVMGHSGAKIETAGSLRNGAVVFMCLRLPTDISVLGDKVKQYVVIMTGHDGSTPILAYFTNVRVVCANTLQMSMTGATQKHSVRHTKNASNKLNEALYLMGLAESNQKVANDTYKRMASKKIKDTQFWSYLANVFLKPKQMEEISKGGDIQKIMGIKLMNQMDGVLRYSTEGPGQNTEKNWWWAYNALTGYYCNAVNYEDGEDRFESLLWNRASDRMERALELAANPTLILDTTFNLN